MKNFFIYLFFVFLFPILSVAGSCSDKLDTYDEYNEVVKKGIDIKSEYYVMSYTWSPNHCSKLSSDDKKPGKKNYLQCKREIPYGYILHGLWPQGSFNKKGTYPRACEGDQIKIKRSILENFLCMTPSLWLLQHEYEFHGTCMHDETLEEPEIYFNKALELHSQLKLPSKQLKYNDENIQWFLDNNPHLTKNSIQYYKGGREWQFCYDNNFTITSCKKSQNFENKEEINILDKCNAIKGNISSKGNKFYFTPLHRDYNNVKINKKGEMCFSNEEEAKKTGWTKAP